MNIMNIMNPKAEVALKVVAGIVVLAFAVGLMWPEDSETPGNTISFTYTGGTHPRFILTMDDNWSSQNQTDMNTLKQSLTNYLNDQTDKDILCGTGSCNINNLKHSS
jgi:hypothetical protein